MRTEQEIKELILGIAKRDERIRAVILNGSRANPNAPIDIFQDFDIIYVVTEIASFKDDSDWLDQFGERMIMQRPDDMGEKPCNNDAPYAFLIQFADGNRIDLTLFPLAKVNEMAEDSLSVLLLDKDDLIKPLPLSSDKSYWPTPPTAIEFAHCCNEFWWVSTYVAKGLWREEIVYARATQEQYVRPMLLRMLVWYIGIKTDFSRNPGKLGKYFQQYLEPELWEILMGSYADASYQMSWESLQNMCQLFRITSRFVAGYFDYAYPIEEDENVMAHLKHVQMLAKDAQAMY